MRQRRVAAVSGLSAGLSTTIKYVRRTASGAAGSSLGTTAKYVRRKRNGAAGSGMGTSIKYLWQTTAAGNRLATTTNYLRGAASIGLGTTTKYSAQCFFSEARAFSLCFQSKSTPEYLPFCFGVSN